MQPQTLDQLFEQAKDRAKRAPDDLAARSALSTAPVPMPVCRRISRWT